MLVLNRKADKLPICNADLCLLGADVYGYDVLLA